jgi:chromosome segregation ATPase
MERKEPTMSSSASLPDTSEPTGRRGATYDELASKPTRKPTPQVSPAVAASSSSLPAIALVIALAAVGGAGFLGWQLFQAQATLKLAEGRILGLEQQLNLTSEESSASLVGLQANMKKFDGDLRKLLANAEDLRKAIAANAERTTAVGRDAAAAKKDGADAKSGLASLKKEVDANKAAREAVVGKVESLGSSIGQQSISVQQLREEVSRLELELADMDSLARRTKANEDAIVAIDDFRRSTNRDLLQIKQQLNSAPK